MKNSAKKTCMPNRRMNDEGIFSMSTKNTIPKRIKNALRKSKPRYFSKTFLKYSI